MNVFQRSDHHLFFLYGTNLNPAQVARRCDKKERGTVARLADQRLAFFGHSTLWDGGYETVIPHPGDEVWGALYRLSFADAERFDAWQDARSDGCGSYFLYPVKVVDSEGRPQDALVYKKDFCGAPGLPSDAQMRFIVQGASLQGLPGAYIERLTGLETRKAGYPVPKNECSARNLLSSACHGCG